MKGQAQQASNFERTVFDDGTYAMTLVKALVMMGKPTKFQPEGAPKILMIWEYEAEGQKYELGDFLGFPKNFAYNDKGNFWKRLSEIAGVKINSDNAETVDIDLGDFVQSYPELLDYINTKNDKGGLEKLEVKSLTVGDQQLMGKQCQLVVKTWTGENGNQGNEIAAVMQIGGGAGPRKPQAQAKATPAPAAQQAPQAASKPPARPAPQQAQPGEVDLPF